MRCVCSLVCATPCVLVLVMSAIIEGTKYKTSLLWVVDQRGHPSLLPQPAQLMWPGVGPERVLVTLRNVKTCLSCIAIMTVSFD